MLLGIETVFPRSQSIFDPASPAGGVDPQPVDSGPGHHRASSSSSSRESSSIRSCASAASAAGTGGEPPQVYGSKPIEIAWTAAPALIVFVLVLVIGPHPVGGRTSRRRSREPGDNALFVTVIGHQWWWEYTYDHYDGRQLGFTTANELHIPAERRRASPGRVYLTLKSADVCHSFWVPRLAGKTDLIPGRTNSHVVPDRRARPVPRPVRRVLRHAARQHAASASSSIRPSDFERWLEQRAKPAVDDPGGARRARRRSSPSRASTATACAARRRRARYAPDLTHLMSRADARLRHGRRTRPRTCAAGSPTRRRSSRAA